MKIKDVIKEHGYTLEQVAALMPNSRLGGQGISKQAMSLIVNGNPQIGTLHNIAEIIGCKVGDFFRDETSCTDTYGFTCPKCGTRFRLTEEEH